MSSGMVKAVGRKECIKLKAEFIIIIIVQELCESRGGRPGLSLSLIHISEPTRLA